MTSSDSWDQSYEHASGARWWPNEELIRTVARHGGQFGSVLEVGCGNGANLWFLTEHADVVVGMDFSQRALDIAKAYMVKRHADERVLLSRHDMLEPLPFGDGEFGLIVDCMSSQHVKDQQHGAVYREYRRVLRRGGLFFLYHIDRDTHCEYTPISSWWVGSNYRLSLFPTVELICVPSSQDLAASVVSAGFSIRQLRRLTKTTGDETASYTIIEAEPA